jgi:hypothetical protein
VVRGVSLQKLVLVASDSEYRRFRPRNRSIFRCIFRYNPIHWLGAVQFSFVGTEDKRGISGGQRKRVSIAMELVTEPSALFLDEPCAPHDLFCKKWMVSNVVFSIAFCLSSTYLPYLCVNGLQDLYRTWCCREEDVLVSFLEKRLTTILLVALQLHAKRRLAS